MNHTGNNEMTRLNRILGETGRLDGIDGLRFGDDGTAGLALDSGIDIFFEFDTASGRLFIHTPLLPLPADPAAALALMETLAHLNFRELHGGGVLALFRRTAQTVHQIDLDAGAVDVQQVDRAIDVLLGRRDELLYQLQLPAPRRDPVPARPAMRRATSFHARPRENQESGQ